MGKVIHWELCKKLKFDLSTKSYGHKPGFILEHETHKILKDFSIQIDPLVLARRPDLVIIYKNVKLSVKWTLPPQRIAEWKSKKALRETVTWTLPENKESCERFGKGVEIVENRRTKRNNPNYSIVENDQNIEKSPGGLRSLAVTWTSLKEHQLTQVTSIGYSIDASIQQPEDYIEKRGRRLIKAPRNNINNTRINWTNVTRKQKWEEKQLYGHYKRQTNDISH